ncbi:hypothetical protein K435DRAFT_971547 [Dendrothele bispora CBS 962.96]|uniref:Uncharacterized protein n=1 Tax=Dendrothele bispora (strain CBS 962.96) TaxID=1314807 RepID=A0A4S8L4Y6_DENBC|nr:hypothetical protein K435DRAFT_971547 [Dendrothele bispora CBS 962.96]
MSSPNSPFYCSQTRQTHGGDLYTVPRSLLEAVCIANCIQDTAKVSPSGVSGLALSTRNKHWVEKLASRASRVVSSAQEEYLQIRKECLERVETSGSTSSGDVNLELALAFGDCFEDLLEQLKNLERDLGIYERQDVTAFMNKEKDLEMLEDHYEKLKAWKTEFGVAVRMLRGSKETIGTENANEATTNRKNPGTTLTPEPAYVRGNSQKVTTTFSSSSISNAVFNNCGGDNVNTSNDHSVNITIAGKVVNHYHAVGEHQRKWKKLGGFLRRFWMF